MNDYFYLGSVELWDQRAALHDNTLLTHSDPHLPHRPRDVTSLIVVSAAVWTLTDSLLMLMHAGLQQAMKQVPSNCGCRDLERWDSSTCPGNFKGPVWCFGNDWRTCTEAAARSIWIHRKWRRHHSFSLSVGPPPADRSSFLVPGAGG